MTLPWPILAKFDLVQPAFLLFIHNSYSALKMVWKDGLILVFRLLKRCLAILGQFWPNFRLKRAKLTTYSIHLGVLSKIHTQYQKLCGNMSLFGFLGFLNCIWPFWTNDWPVFGQIWPWTATVWTFYVKFILSSYNCVEKWFCLAL